MLEIQVRELQEILAAKETANKELQRQNEYFKELFSQQEELKKETERTPVVLPPEALKS